MHGKKFLQKLTREYCRLLDLQDLALDFERKDPSLSKQAEAGNSIEGLLNDASSAISEAIDLMECFY